MKGLIKKLSKKIIRRENAAILILSMIAVLFVVVGAIKACFPYEEIGDRIERAEYGEPGKAVTVIAETEYEGNVMTRKAVLDVQAKKLSKDEIKARFEKCRKDLPKIILADNESESNIESDLNLISFHEKTGVSISWVSSRPDLIDENGTVYPKPEKDNGYVLLTATMGLEGQTEEWKCNLKHGMKLNEGNADVGLEKGIKDLRKQTGDSGEDFVSLPSEFDSGLKIKWKTARENNCFIYAAIAAILAVFIYSKRKADQSKAAAERREAIEKEFPYFLDKLVMLLSAGIILSEAVERIAEDYVKYSADKNRSLFYEELAFSVRSMKESNSSFSEELMKLSRRLDVREFARLSVILRDSLESGMDMVSKLEEESIMIWGERKSSVQKLGRTADTKLVFPLVIILLVLIIIVMAPALLQM